MTRRQRGIIIWIAVTLAFFIALFYPAMVYLDLAGMGGYDGFAPSEMMLNHGAWRENADPPTAVYLMFAAIYAAWLFSPISLGLGSLLLGIAAVFRKRVQQ